MNQKFFIECAKGKRHCHCGCGQVIVKGEKVIVFDNRRRQGNLKIDCAQNLIDKVD